jgi:hypothetical protein
MVVDHGLTNFELTLAAADRFPVTQQILPPNEPVPPAMLTLARQPPWCPPPATHSRPPSPPPLQHPQHRIEHLVEPLADVFC